jgi:hypothetical protein
MEKLTHNSLLIYYFNGADVIFGWLFDRFPEANDTAIYISI